jgi:hypothetical protein
VYFHLLTAGEYHRLHSYLYRKNKINYRAKPECSEKAHGTASTVQNSCDTEPLLPRKTALRLTSSKRELYVIDNRVANVTWKSGHGKFVRQGKCR